MSWMTSVIAAVIAGGIEKGKPWKGRPGATGQACVMPVSRSRHLSQKLPIARATPAPCPCHARASVLGSLVVATAEPRAGYRVYG
eukprot:gene7023-biopygen22489